MKTPVVAVVSILGVLSGVPREEAHSEPLTVMSVIELVKNDAPAVLAAATQVEEARGRLTQARALGSENPTLEGLKGSAEDFDNGREIELGIPVGLGLRRSRQVSGAKANLEMEQHLLTDTKRRAIGAALSAYYQVLHAERRLALAQDRKLLADELVRIATEKLRTGDAARLELLIAEGEQSQAQSAVLSEEAEVIRTRVSLASILGLSSGAGIELIGDLSDRTLFDSLSLIAVAERRADVLAAESQVKAASAAVGFANLAWLPNVAFRVNYQYAQEEKIVRPGLAISLPIFDVGQGSRRQAKAQRQRAAIDYATQRSTAAAEAEGAKEEYAKAVASAQEAERIALPRALETESLSKQGYEAGKLNLSELLIVRNSALEARRGHVERLLEAALAGVNLIVATGAIP